MESDNDPRTKVSGEERIIDCNVIGVVTWQISQALWDHLQGLSGADREQILDIMARRFHLSAHDITVQVAEFVAKKTASTKIEGNQFPSSWLHET